MLTKGWKCHTMKCCTLNEKQLRLAVTLWWKCHWRGWQCQLHLSRHIESLFSLQKWKAKLMIKLTYMQVSVWILALEHTALECITLHRTVQMLLMLEYVYTHEWVPKTSLTWLRNDFGCFYGTLTTFEQSHARWFCMGCTSSAKTSLTEAESSWQQKNPSPLRTTTAYSLQCTTPPKNTSNWVLYIYIMYHTCLEILPQG